MSGVERTEHQLNGGMFLRALRQMCLEILSQHKMTIIVRTTNEVRILWRHKSGCVYPIHADERVLICNHLNKTSEFLFKESLIKTNLNSKKLARLHIK